MFVLSYYDSDYDQDDVLYQSENKQSLEAIVADWYRQVDISKQDCLPKEIVLGRHTYHLSDDWYVRGNHYIPLDPRFSISSDNIEAI